MANETLESEEFSYRNAKRFSKKTPKQGRIGCFSAQKFITIENTTNYQTSQIMKTAKYLDTI